MIEWRMRSKRIAALFFLAVALCGTASSLFARELPRAESGVLDLRDWDFQRDGPVPLDGVWRFFPHALLRSSLYSTIPAWRSLPDRWNANEAGAEQGTGAATYVLRVLLPRNCPELAVRWLTVSTAFELDVNGRKVGGAGVPGLDPASTLPAYKPSWARMGPVSGHLDLVLRVANWEYRVGGPWRSLVLGEEYQIGQQVQQNYTFTWALAAALLALSLNSLIIFLYRRRERANLFFSLFALVMIVRVLVTGEYLITLLVPTLPFHCLIRLEYLSLLLLLFMGRQFFLNFFPQRLPRWTRITVHGIMAAYAVFCLIVPLRWLTWSIYGLYVISLAIILGIFITVILPALISRVQGAFPIFVGALVLSVSVVNDILFNAFVINSVNTLPIALVGFLLLQMAALAGRFALSINQTETLTHELSETNRRLRDEVIDNVRKQEALEQLLDEKDMLIREVHHRVKNSLGIVSSIVSLQSRRGGESVEAESLRMLRLRIQALSLVHEKLYVTSASGSIILADYLSSLVDQLAKGFGLERERLVLEQPEQEIELSVDAAVDIGLVLTELVANACKYGLGTDGSGLVTVRMALEAGNVLLEVQDSGPGFPAGFDPTASVSLGYLMISTVLKRLRGKLEIMSGAPGRVKVSFVLDNLNTMPLLGEG